MRKMFKRSMALLLTFCMLLSVLPPVVIATTGAEGSQTQVSYDISKAALETLTGNSYANKYFYNLPDTTVQEYYENGSLNWMIAASNKDSFVGDTYSATTSYLGCGSGSSWSGLRLALDATKADGSGHAYLTGYWFAFNIASPGAGKYAVNLNYQTRADSNRNVKVYLLPGGLTDPAAIDAALANATSLTSGFDGRSNTDGSVNNTWTFTDASRNLGERTFTDQAYTLVVRCDSTSGNYFFLNGLTMTRTGDAPESTVPQQDFDFTMSTTATATGISLTNKYFYDLPDTTLQDPYTNGTINWLPAASNKNSFVGDTYSATTSYLGYGSGSSWTGLRLALDATKADGSGHAYLTDYWFAFNIRSCAAGEYAVSLNYQTRADSNRDVKVYLLSGGLTDPATIQSAMDAAQSLTTGFDSRTKSDGNINNTWTYTDASKDLGVHTIAEGDYTLVVHCASNSGNYFFLNGLTMVPVVPDETTPPEETTAPTEPTAPQVHAPATAPAKQQVNALHYNFALGSTELTTTGGKSFAGAVMNQSDPRTAIESHYALGKLYWMYTTDNLTSLKTATNTVVPTYFFGGGSYKWTGLRLGVNVKDGSSNTYPAGYWTAMRIVSPGAGKYQLTLDYQTRADGTQAGEVYLLPGTYDSAAAIEAAMTKERLLQTVNFSSAAYDMEDNQTVLGTVDMVQGEYTLVFKATQTSANGVGAYFYITSINALHETQIPAPPAPPQLDTGVYDFVLEDTNLTYSSETRFAAAVFTNVAVQSAIDKYYKNGDLNWKFHSAYIPEGSTSQGAMFGGTVGDKTYSWNGLRFYSMGVTVPMWQAFTIQSPGSGTYYPALNYMKNIVGASVGKIYLLPGDTVDVAAAIASGKALGQISYDNRTGGNAEAASEVFYDQPLELTAGEEYILVFTAEEPGVKTGENKFAYIYLNQFILYSEKTLPDPGPNVLTYDFDVTDRANGIYTEGKVEMKNIKSDIASRYAKGEISWKLEEIASTMTYDLAFVNYAGMVSYSNEDDYMAFRCKAPGDGVYTLTMNYATSSNGALGAVYILPGNTEDVATAMDHSNRIKKVAFYNESGEAATKDGSTVTLGTWNFKSGEEFIIVFEAYDNSPYSNFAYMFISQVVATEGNHVKAETANREVSSILVNADPVKTYETTQYGTTSVVNGQDYLFVAVEGKRMIIYNLDDMTKVRTVRTPFTVCRGMTTDKDGMVWLVGDKPVVFRYDPYTGTSMTTRNYGAEIPQCYGGFSCTTDDAGNLYFGSYQIASIVKYSPDTDTFTNLGEFNDDAGYSCGVIIKDNYLYAGITGDRNGDGLRTTEILKIDLDTYKCVDRVDITEKVGPDEVMVRGTGIGGDTLFVGGIQMEDFIAIDINTMELKEYDGFYKQIAYCGSEELDGKMYFAVSGVGLCEYDIATDTITDLRMETAAYGLRCAEHSFVTLDDPLYPGKTLVTYRSEGILLYNPEARRVGYITDLVDEEADGSGMNIITMANGPEGTDEIYLGAFNTNNCTAISTKTGEISRVFEAVSAQTDVMLWYEGALYTGNYTSGAIVRINTSDEERNVVLLSMNNDLYEQNRVHCLAAGDNMLFGGTMPRTDTYGGALAVIDLETLEYKVVRNIVEGQSVTGLVYKDGYVYGTTSTSGGTGTNGPAFEGASAKIFVYDVAKGEKVGELDLRDHISGLPATLPYVDGITVDPNGKFWGLISETLFSFTFDAATGEFQVKEELSFGKTDFPGNNNRYARACSFDYKDGFMYVAMGNKGGMRKIDITKASNNVRLNCETPRCFVIAEDGNLYYSIATAELKMYPLDVTDADWQTAEQVDALIEAIGTSVTLESEEAIRKARAAYDALSWRHRALVQKYDQLQIAETDLLEAKIDAIGTVTLESRTLIEGLLATYDALPEKQLKYVKNYDVLYRADQTLQELINAEKAAEVQKLIDSIRDMGTITLEHNSDIVAIRDAYNALTYLQRQLVDTTLLDEAEAALAALWKEVADRLTGLIASIGDVTLEDEQVINEALELFNSLSLDMRQQVDYTTLNAAEKALKKLQKAAAGEVDSLIEAIGSVGIFSGSAIRKAREAYNALTEGSKAYVKLLDTLTAAEEAYAPLDGIAVIAIVAAAAVLVAGGIGAGILVNKKKKRSVSEQQ